MQQSRVSTVVRRTTLFAVVAALVVLLRDYFTPAELQVDLNAPRFRLVRHRIILPDQEFEMAWKHVTDWAETAEESPPIFGERSRGGLYAWEIGGRVMSRVDTLEAPSGPNDEWIRTNYGCYWISTRDLNSEQRVAPRTQWAASYPHQRNLTLTQTEIDSADAAISAHEKALREQIRKGIEQRLKDLDRAKTNSDP